MTRRKKTVAPKKDFEKNISTEQEQKQNHKPSSLGIRTSWWNFFFPQLSLSMDVVIYDKPSSDLIEKKYSKFQSFWALFATIAVLTTIYLITLKAPSLNPKQTYLIYFRPFIAPDINFEVASVVIFGALISAFIPFSMAIYVAKKLGESASDKAIGVQPLIVLTTITGVSIFSVSLLITLGVVYLLNWLGYSTIMEYYLAHCILITPIGLTWWFKRFFIKNGFKNNFDTLLRAFLIAGYLSVPAVINAEFINFYLFKEKNKIEQENKKKIEEARKTPIPAEIEMCEIHQKNISCAIILRSRELQDFELIGNWRLGDEISTKKSSQYIWQAQSDSSKHFQLVSIDENKSKTIELSIPIDRICINKHSLVNAEDVLFTARGRRKYVNEKFSEGFGIKIDNKFSSFQNMLEEVCTRAG